MIDLKQMSEKDYEKFREDEIKKYAQMKIDTNEWEPSNSYSRAESDLNYFLPTQPSTEGLVFLSIIDIDTGNCVGTICYGRLPNQSIQDTYIYDIRIYDEYQRKGYGQMALSELEDRLRHTGIKNMILDVSVYNKAAELLYGKSGFITTHYRMKKKL